MDWNLKIINRICPNLLSKSSRNKSFKPVTPMKPSSLIKGGRYKEDILAKYGARFVVNLENLGCPKFKELLERVHLKNIINSIRWRTAITKRVTCGRHIQDRRNCHFYCPVEEVRNFAAWVVTQRLLILCMTLHFKNH